MGEGAFASRCRESFSRRREERVDVALLECVVWVVKLALDSPIVPGPTFSSDEVNSHVHARAIGAKTPIQALKEWQQKKPELFVKRVYDQTGLDS